MIRAAYREINGLQATSNKDLVQRIGALKLIPVIAMESADDADRLAEALLAGGLPCAEITLRTEAGLEALRRLSKFPDMLLGAGTVHSPTQAEQVAEAGAQFVVTPGFNARTVRWCLDHRLPVLPGIATPSDLEQALEYGIEVVKFFPAEALGGIKMLQALMGPYYDMRFVPTGGISASNVRDYLALPAVIACGGSWMVKSELISSGRFDEISRLTREAMQIIKSPG